MVNPKTRSRDVRVNWSVVALSPPTRLKSLNCSQRVLWLYKPPTLSTSVNPSRSARRSGVSIKESTSGRQEPKRIHIKTTNSKGVMVNSPMVVLKVLVVSHHLSTNARYKGWSALLVSNAANRCIQVGAIISPTVRFLRMTLPTMPRPFRAPREWMLAYQVCAQAHKCTNISSQNFQFITYEYIKRIY
ncbi:hypothetical protein JCGZ_15405 [Jatropha curcas]|uniref:Uncharacterized protein n=1 Tax=Jatropha curcas TaxID=180498 RepID=A0A067KI46_JATCU|nr:hypothetical protein JCGZ_15405 [Jatropha curcas]